MSQRAHESAEGIPAEAANAETHATDLLRCRVCHDQCFAATSEAVVSGRQTLATSRKALFISEVRKGRLDWTPAAIHAMYSALSSGIQHEFCVHFGDPAGWPDETPYVRAARRAIVRAGRAPQAAVDVLAAWRRSGNPYGDEDRSVGGGAESSRTVLFADAASRHWVSALPEPLTAIAAVLDPPARMLSAGFSGFELLDLGYVDEAVVALARLADRLEGVALVVSDSPEAVWMINEGPRLMGREALATAVHLLPYLLSVTKQHRQLVIAPSKTGEAIRGRSVTYHDPSYLSRYGDGGDAAREIIREALGAQLVEMMYNRRRALPAGPYLGFPNEKEAVEIGMRRIDEALATGSEVLLTASPFDYFNLSRASAGAIQVAYLPALVQLTRIS